VRREGTKNDTTTSNVRTSRRRMGTSSEVV
jgi:hypothetical protein